MEGQCFLALLLSLDKKQSSIIHFYNLVVSSADHYTEFFVHVTNFFFYNFTCERDYVLFL